MASLSRPSLTERLPVLPTRLLTDLLFSLKTLLAGLLAYYLALRIGLERPYWSLISCYIVAQPLTGALVSKGVFRLIGTLIGAVAAILMVPNLGSAPELLVGAMALWFGGCTYVAALDRTPRSYLALLAGYSAIIIGMASVDTPGAIFDVATLRVQEISLGIVSVSFVHSLLLPRPVSRQLCDGLDTMVADAERWSAEALAASPQPQRTLWKDRHRLATDLHDLHLLSTHLPYELAATALDVATLRALETEIALLLPIASAVEDRLSALRTSDSLTAPVQDLIEDVRQWIASGDPAEAPVLTARARQLEPEIDRSAPCRDLLILSLLDRLTHLIGIHATIRGMRDRLVRDGARLAPFPPGRKARARRRRSLHRDHAVALRAAMATMMTVVAGCAFWIMTGWPDGATAIIAAAILCALFSHLDSPGRHAGKAFCGTAFAVIAAAIWGYAILPLVSDFGLLCMVIAPPFLLLGWMLAHPHRAPYGIGAVLAFPALVGLSASPDPDFGTFANQAVAQILGSLLACTMLVVVRKVSNGDVAKRLTRAGWQELARKTLPSARPDTTAWISQMLDRMVLLGMDDRKDREEDDRLRTVRIGLALDDLQRASIGLDRAQVRHASLLRARLRAEFDKARQSGRFSPGAALVRAIDRAIGSACALPASKSRRELILALVGLRHVLSPFG